MLPPLRHAVAALDRLVRPFASDLSPVRRYATKNGPKTLGVGPPAPGHAPPPPPRDRPPAEAPVAAPAEASFDAPTAAPERARKRRPKAPAAASTLHIAPGSPHHDSLPSFLAYTARAGLDPTSKVYLGTHYEYTVAEALRRLRFALTRVGRASDRGIDLLGEWAVPGRPRPLRVLVQAKAEAPRPAMVRELEGAVVGAPAAWRAGGVVAILVAAKEATKGVREAITRTAVPMAFLNVTPDAVIRQFVWNQAAVDAGLEGVGVTLRYSAQQHHEIVLTSDGRPWPKAESRKLVIEHPSS